MVDGLLQNILVDIIDYSGNSINDFANRHCFRTEISPFFILFSIPVAEAGVSEDIFHVTTSILEVQYCALSDSSHVRIVIRRFHS